MFLSIELLSVSIVDEGAVGETGQRCSKHRVALFCFSPNRCLGRKKSAPLKDVSCLISSVNGGRTVYTTTKIGGKRGKILRKRC